MNPRPTKLTPQREPGGLMDPELSDTEADGAVPTPLSSGQRRLWFLDRMQPDSPLYNIAYLLRLRGPLDLTALERSLEFIIARHESLRTTFTTVGEDPVPLVLPPPLFHLPLDDRSGVPEARRESELRQLVRAEATRPFNLTDNLMLRARLVRLGKTDHALVLVMHHIAADGWSMAILYRELGALYDAFSRGQPSPLRALPIQYGDYAASQRECLQGEALAQLLDFWKQQLAGAPALLELPADHPRPAVQLYRGDLLSVQFPPALGAALKELSRRHRATLFMTLLAAFKVLLHRYTGQADLVIGSPVAGRDRPETESLIGFFVNTLVLRTDLSGDPTFAELLARVREVALAAYDHQEIPFEMLVEELHPARNLSHNPLCQVVFALQNMPSEPLNLAGVTLGIEPVHTGTAKSDLMVWVSEEPAGLSVTAEYNTDLFLPDTIRRLLGHFRTLLEGVVRNAETRISLLPLLTEHERETILLQWNNTRTEFESEKCVHQLLEEQVQRTPDAVAVVFEDQQLTYRELDGRANALAGRLRALGVGADVRVAICLHRSLEMMVALLGVLKAGGCYVPLDPTYPKERLAFMLKDSQAPVVLTQESLRDEFDLLIPPPTVLCLGTDPDAMGQDNVPRQSRPVSEARRPISTDLAYVMYTSGSTGRPKGVMISHRNVVNFFAGMDRVLGMETGLHGAEAVSSAPAGVWLAVTSISFDISVLELFWTLARGFKVVIQPDDWRAAKAPTDNGGRHARRSRSIPEQILRHGVSHLQCTPSLARTLVLAPESVEALRRLNKLLLGGEALPLSLARQLHPLVPCLLNMYGPTETTIWSACHRVGEAGHSVPIGRPITNTQIRILDRELQPVPIGVPGEILIGGEGVARGYLNRPELTVERFVRDPFNAEGEARLYRTGDLGRWLPDGTIEFLGRLDFQLKIRGHRIEPGEIESALGRHPAVQETVVVACETSPGDPRLVAYLVAAPNARLTATELRRFAQRELPEAMIPSAFVFLDSLPLTPNGKVNRKALPAPETGRPELEADYAAPRRGLEQAIGNIWRELLHVEQVGRHDNFFDLGGHSLLIVQVQARLRAAFSRDVPVVKLFQHPTISALADFLAEPERSSVQKSRDRGHRKQAASTRGFKQEPATTR